MQEKQQLILKMEKLQEKRQNDFEETFNKGRKSLGI